MEEIVCSMAKRDDIIDEAFLYVTKKKYPDRASTTKKRIINKKAENFVIADGELYYKPGREKKV